MTSLDVLWVITIGFICFGAGLAFSQKLFSHTIATKADTGMRLECDGRLYVVKHVKTQENDIAGAIYDFAAFLTTRRQTIEVGSTANASPMVELIKEWAELRDLSLEDADVEGWNLK